MASTQCNPRPLAAPHNVGRDSLKQLGLKTELPVTLDGDRIPEIADLAVTAHAPFAQDGVRLNVASPDPERRSRSRDLIRSYIEQAGAFPNVRTVVCHAAPKIWYAKDGHLQQTGDYALLVEGLRELADAAKEQGLSLAVENNRAYYHDEFPNCPGVPERASENFYLGTSPEEWRLIARDVDRDNFALCLDTSHACTFAHLFPNENRASVLMRFLAEPDLISHVHWSDNVLFGRAGRKDAHLPVGEGTLPLAFHRALLRVNATMLLEHFYDLPRLKTELEFIGRL